MVSVERTQESEEGDSGGEGGRMSPSAEGDPYIPALGTGEGRHVTTSLELFVSISLGKPLPPHAHFPARHRSSH